jgi:hypothetical protein
MEILPLLRKRLKDDGIVERLDDWDVEVIYDFDRTHENIEDVYWAQAKDLGITMRFDQTQTLNTVFIYLKPIDGHTPFSPSNLEDVHAFNTVSEVEQHAVERGIAFRKSFRPDGLPPAGEWIRLEYPQHRVHYDFREGDLHILTISSVDETQ